MTDREKLIEMCENFILSCKSSLCADCEHNQIDYPHCMGVHFADHLFSNGVIVPPCKVGDKIYAISDSRIIECTCYEFFMHNELTISAEFACEYDCKGCPFNSWSQDYSGEYSCKGEYGEHFFTPNDFGKTVFLSREEAEKALKERSEGK